jgi:hypothetical protein
VLRRIFGTKGEEVVGDWRRLHNEELHNLYVSPNIIRVIKSKEGKTYRACSTRGREETFLQHIFRRTWREETTRKSLT